MQGIINIVPCSGRKRMLKKLFLALLFCASSVFCSMAYAEDINLHWDSNPETYVAGYKIHWGTTEGIYPDSFDVGDVLSYSLTLDVGKYYITVTAYDIDNNESAYSYALIYLVALGTVTGIGIS